MTDSFLHLIFDEGIVPCTFNRDIHYKEEVNTDRARQTRQAVYLFNFLHGRRGLPYLRLFIPANRLVAFCLQVTQTLSLRRLLIQ